MKRAAGVSVHTLLLQSTAIRAINRPRAGHAARERGRSSGVEHNLAKVGVVSSNLIARSSIQTNFQL